MTSSNDTGTLGEFFAMDALVHSIKKKTFGGYDVPLGIVVSTGLWVFQKGAILGRARKDHLDVLARLLADPADEARLLSFFRDTGKEMGRHWGEARKTLRDFWMSMEYPQIDWTNPTHLKQLSKQNVRLGEALPRFTNSAACGIAFGAMNSELFEELWREMYEYKVNPDEWSQARKSGLDITPEQTPLPLGEMEQIVLTQVAQYVQNRSPQLLKPLNLLIVS